MSFTNQTTHYGLPQWIGSDKPTYLVDQNNAYLTIDSEIYNANVTAGEAVTTANGASSTAGAASATAADALSAAQTASTTADSALTAAQDAGTVAQAAQTAAGAAQTAAEAAQAAAAGNSITNLAPAYDSTITYAVGALVTQDGKLYQCITQVSTPEAFDINKWDDKTTSEVFYIKSESDIYGLVGRSQYNIPANTYSTMEDALKWIGGHAKDIFNLKSDELAKIISFRIVGYARLDPLDETLYDSDSNYLVVSFQRCEVRTSDILHVELSPGPNNPTYRTGIIENGSLSIVDRLSNPQSELVIIFDKFKKL